MQDELVSFETIIEQRKLECVKVLVKHGASTMCTSTAQVSSSDNYAHAASALQTMSGLIALHLLYKSHM